MNDQLTIDEIVAIGKRVNAIEASDDGGYFFPITFAREIEHELAARFQSRAQAAGVDTPELRDLMTAYCLADRSTSAEAANELIAHIAALAAIQPKQGGYRWYSMDGKQHDAGRVVTAAGNYFATTGSPEDAKLIADALNAATPSEGVAQYPCFGVFRQRPNENNGVEYLHYAMHHDKDSVSEGERRVPSYFTPSEGVGAGDGLDAAWDEYAKRSSLIVDGVASDPAKAQTAYFAFAAAWKQLQTDLTPPLLWNIHSVERQGDFAVRVVWRSCASASDYERFLRSALAAAQPTKEGSEAS